MEHIAFVRQKEINAYPIRNIPGMSWETGDLVVHMAGCWVNNECNKQWKEMMAQRVPVDDGVKAMVKAAKAATGAPVVRAEGAEGGVEVHKPETAKVEQIPAPAQQAHSQAVAQPVHAPETAPVAAAV
jgi:hypothetical protein